MKKFWSVLFIICTILLCSTFALSANAASATSTKTQSVCKITTQPKTTYAKKGATVKVTVNASGKGLKYQWYIKDSGAKKYSKRSTTSATYSVKMSSKVNNRYV